MDERPKNVLNNNLVRAYIVNCFSSSVRIEPPEAGEEMLRLYPKELADFVKQHQNTCAIYECVLIATDHSIDTGYEVMCPKCRLSLEVVGED